MCIKVLTQGASLFVAWEHTTLKPEPRHEIPISSLMVKWHAWILVVAENTVKWHGTGTCHGVFIPETQY